MSFHLTTGDLGDNEGNKSLPATLEVISVCWGRKVEVGIMHAYLNRETC